MRHRNLVATMRVADDIEVGTLGKWEVEKHTVTAADVTQQVGSMYSTGRYTPAGTYAGLQRSRVGFLDHISRTLVMSDAPDELRDLFEPIYRASLGDVRTVLIHGLGLGCFVKGLTSFDHIESIDIVEIDEELIELMPPLASWLRDPRVTIHHDDAYTRKWPVGSHWDVVWHDLWDDLDVDNLSTGYAKLNRRFGGRSGWQGAWGQDFLERMRDR